MIKDVIHTAHAPAAIGPYSQAVRVGTFVFLSGQIPLDPVTMQLVSGGIQAEAMQVFKNLSAVCEAAAGSLQSIVKLTIYLTDLGLFNEVNEVMASFFEAPYPARVTLGVSALPRGASIEVEALMVV